MVCGDLTQCGLVALYVETRKAWLEDKRYLDMSLLAGQKKEDSNLMHPDNPAMPPLFAQLDDTSGDGLAPVGTRDRTPPLQDFRELRAFWGRASLRGAESHYKRYVALLGRRK